MARVAGKVVIVTGGASGIGEACSTLLAAQGATVVVADLADKTGNALAAKLTAESGGKHRFRHHDVTDENSWQKLIAETERDFGHLDGLVNNAGVSGPVPAADIEHESLETWRKINAVNLEGVFLGCKHAVPALRRAGKGSIVNISSLAALVGTPGLTAYGAGKAGVRQLTKSVAMHCALRGDKIRCNSVHPGVIVTPMGDQVIGPDERRRAKLLKTIPVKTFGEPNDIGYCVVYLISDESKFATGAEFVIDGGMSAL